MFYFYSYRSNLLNLLIKSCPQNFLLSFIISLLEKSIVCPKKLNTSTIYCCTSFDKEVEKCFDTVLDFFKLNNILKACRAYNIIQGTKLNAFLSTILTIMVVIFCVLVLSGHTLYVQTTTN